MVGKPLQLLVLFLCIFVCSACGYLDDEILLDEETYAQTLQMEGMGIRGSGHGWGCGGGRFLRRARLPRVYHRSLLDSIYLEGMVIRAGGHASGAVAGMSDDEILNATDVEMIDESVPIEGSVEEVYNEAKRQRDEAILTHYAGG